MAAAPGSGTQPLALTLDTASLKQKRQGLEQEQHALIQAINQHASDMDRALIEAQQNQEKHVEQLAEAKKAQEAGVVPKLTEHVVGLDTAEKAIAFLSSHLQRWEALGVGNKEENIFDVFRDTQWPVRQGEPGFRLLYTWYMLRYAAQPAVAAPVSCPGASRGFSLTPYQRMQVAAFHPRTNARRGCVFAATGTGKTMTMAAITDAYIAALDAPPRLTVWALASQGAALELTQKLIKVMGTEHSKMVAWALGFLQGHNHMEEGQEDLAQACITAWAWQFPEQATWRVGEHHSFGDVVLRAPILMGPATDLLFSSNSSVFKDTVTRRKRWFVYKTRVNNMTLLNESEPTNVEALFKQFLQQHPDQAAASGSASDSVAEEEEESEGAGTAPSWADRMRAVAGWYTEQRSKLFGGSAEPEAASPEVMRFNVPGNTPVLMLIDEVHKWSQWLSGAIPLSKISETDKRTFRVALALQEYHTRGAWGKYWAAAESGVHMQHRLRNGFETAMRVAVKAAQDVPEGSGRVEALKEALDRGMSVVNGDTAESGQHFQQYPDNHVIIGFTATPLQSSPRKDLAALLKMLYGIEVKPEGGAQLPPGLSEGLWSFYNPTDDPVMPRVLDPVVIPCMPLPATLTTVARSAKKLLGQRGVDLEDPEGPTAPLHTLVAQQKGDNYLKKWVGTLQAVSALEAGSGGATAWARKNQYYTIIPSKVAEWGHVDATKSPSALFASLPRPLQRLFTVLCSASADMEARPFPVAEIQEMLRNLGKRLSGTKRTKELERVQELLRELDPAGPKKDPVFTPAQTRRFVRGAVLGSELDEPEEEWELRGVPYSPATMEPQDWVFGHKLHHLLNILARDPLTPAEVADPELAAALPARSVRKTVVWVSTPGRMKRAYIETIRDWVCHPAHQALWNRAGVARPNGLCAYGLSAEAAKSAKLKRAASEGIRTFNRDRFGQEHALLFVDADEFREGYDMENVQSMVFLGAPIHFGEYLQYVGRAKRFCFHRDFVEAARQVRVYMVATAGMPDEMLWNKCMAGAPQVLQWNTFMEQAAIDAPLHALRAQLSSRTLPAFSKLWEQAEQVLGLAQRRTWHAWAMGTLLRRPAVSPTIPWYTGLMLQLQGMLERRAQRQVVQTLTRDAPRIEAAVAAARAKVEEAGGGSDPEVLRLREQVDECQERHRVVQQVLLVAEDHASKREDWERMFWFPSERVTQFA